MCAHKIQQALPGDKNLTAIQHLLYVTHDWSLLVPWINQVFYLLIVSVSCWYN